MLSSGYHHHRIVFASVVEMVFPNILAKEKTEIIGRNQQVTSGNFSVRKMIFDSAQSVLFFVEL